MCKHAGKKLPYLIRYVPGQYKTQQMCDKAILENGGTLKSVSGCYKNQEMCNKAVENNPHALEFVPECYKTKKMYNKAFDTYPFTIKLVTECYNTKEMFHRAVHQCFFVFDSMSNKYKTQEICNLAFSLYFPLIVYCPYKYITQEMCDEAVDDSPAALKLLPDWFVTSKIIKSFFAALYADENVVYFNEYSDNVVFSCNVIGILNIDLKNISLDDNFDEDDHNTIIPVRLLAWHIKFEKHKALKKI